MLTREVPKQQTTTLFSLKILIFNVNWLYKSKVRISVILLSWLVKIISRPTL